MTRPPTMREYLEPLVSSGREAFKIADSILISIVTALRRDRRFADVKFVEFELLLADALADAETRMFEEMRDRIHFDDIDEEWPI